MVLQSWHNKWRHEAEYDVILAGNDVRVEMIGERLYSLYSSTDNRLHKLYKKKK